MTDSSNPMLAIKAMIDAAQTILILQPDSPDGDSLGSALGLEELLGNQGKEVLLYAYKEPESYLHSLEGWDRVSTTLPKRFDATILVDTGSPALIKSTLAHHAAALMAKPFAIIDHHASQTDFGFRTVSLIEPAAATAEMITAMALAYDWPLTKAAADKLAFAILSDSLNLTTAYTTARTVAMLAELVAAGANLFDLYRIKRETSALTPALTHLKGRLLASIEFHHNDRLAIAVIPPDVVAMYQDVHEPYNLIINEMQWTKGVEIAAVFKNYGTKINVPLRSANGHASSIAEKFGGGGHLNAAAYRCESTDIEREKELLVLAFAEYIQEVDDAAL